MTYNFLDSHDAHEFVTMHHDKIKVGDIFIINNEKIETVSKEL